MMARSMALCRCCRDDRRKGACKANMQTLERIGAGPARTYRLAKAHLGSGYGAWEIVMRQVHHLLRRAQGKPYAHRRYFRPRRRAGEACMGTPADLDELQAAGRPARMAATNRSGARASCSGSRNWRSMDELAELWSSEYGKAIDQRATFNVVWRSSNLPAAASIF